MNEAEGRTSVDGHKSESGLVLLEGRALGSDGGVDGGDPGGSVGPFGSDGERLGGVQLEMVEERSGVIRFGRSRDRDPRGQKGAWSVAGKSRWN